MRFDRARGAEPAKRQRDEAFDIAKGVGILAVVGLHLTNRSARLFHQPFDDSWWTLTWLNRFLNFCVPLFLLISAILLARSLASQERPDWRRFVWRRGRSVLLPLLVWSAIYWLHRAYVQHEARLLDPAYWQAYKARLFDLAFGKAEFHLYFLSVLAQLCLILPFCFLFFRKVKVNFWVMLLIAITVQTAAFAVQKVVRFDYPGATVFWYLSTVIPGIWVGLNWQDWPRIRGMSWLVWAVLSIGGFAIFGYESWLEILKANPNGTVMNAAAAAYELGMPFAILGLVTLWTSSAPWLRGSLRRLGELSLQVYLIHPLVLHFLTRKLFLGWFGTRLLPSLWFFLATLAGTLLITMLLEWIGFLNPILFGRDLPRRKAKAPPEPIDQSTEEQSKLSG